MRKRCLLALLLFLSLVLLTSCHGSQKSAAFVIPDEFDTSRDYEITFWAKNDTNKAQTDIYYEAIRQFENTYPNIHVSMRLYTDYSRIYNDVITNIATKTTPNVCVTYPDHIATYLTGDHVVVSLDELLTHEKYGLGGTAVHFDAPKKNEMVSSFLNECIVKDHYYAVPFMRSTEACYVNKTFVEALGYTLPDVLTWDFVWEVSEAAMKKDDKGLFVINGQKVLIPFIYKSTDNMMIQMLRQRNIPYSDSEGNILLFNEQTTDILKTIDVHAKTRAFSTFKVSSYPANFLNAGQCIFAVDSTAGSTWMGSKAPLSDIPAEQYVDFETAVCMIPQFDPASPAMISQGPSICLFEKEDPQEVLASWLFTQYLLSDYVQTSYAETEGYVPVTEKARATESYQTYLASEGLDNKTYYDVKIKATKLLIENTNNTFVTPVFNGSASLRDAAGQLIENVVKSARRKEQWTPESLYSSITSLYRLDQISQGSDKTETQNLPPESIALLAIIAGIWLIILLTKIIAYVRTVNKCH